MMTISSELPITNGTNGYASHAAPDLTAERERLEMELEAARQRLIDGRERALAREAASIEALRDAVAASRITLAQLEREHEEAVLRLRAATESEVERILSEAQTMAQTLGSGVEAVRRLVNDVE